MRERIQTLDGLRFLAALGVLWIHSWTAFGNARCYIGKIDLCNILAIGGNGVDLFFVISGFCMYYFYGNKPGFTYADFFKFLKKRWWRLSPAFYAATVIYLLVFKFYYHNPVNFTYSILNSLLYLNALVPYSAASHFWTLSVEWQFYILIPFILLYQYTLGFNKIFFGIFISLALIGVVCVMVLKGRSDELDTQIIFRGVQFACGVFVAHRILNHNRQFKYRGMWLIAFIVLVYLGRICISKTILGLSANYYNLFKLLGFTLMGIGFAGVLHLSLTSKKWLLLILGNKLFKTMGRISYSFYLWHALIFPFVVAFIISKLPAMPGIAAPLITTIISAIILYPVSMLSYTLLEKPFLKVGNLTSKAATLSAN